MNFNKTWILFGVLGALVLVFIGIVALTPPKKADETYVLPSLKAADNPVALKDVDTVVIERTAPKDEKIVFEHDKEDDRWRMTEPFPLHDTRVDKGAVDRLVDQVMNARKDTQADVNNDLKQWGLDKPEAVVTLKTDKKEYKINLGKSVKTSGGQTSVVYVTSSDRPQEVMAVHLNTLDEAYKPVNDFRSKDLLASSPADIQLVTLWSSKQEPVTLAKKSGTRWTITQPNLGEADYEGPNAGGFTPSAPGKAEPGVRGLLDVLTTLRVQNDKDFVSEDTHNLEQYGLADKQKDRFFIKVKRSLGSFGVAKNKDVTDTLVIGKKVQEKGDTYYAMLDSDKYVVKVTANLKPLEEVLTNPGALRDRDLVHTEGLPINVVAIGNSSGDFEIVKPPDAFQWKVYRGKQAPQTADDTAVQDLLDAVQAKRLIEEFRDAKADDKALGLDQPTAVVSLWADGVEKETKDNKKDDKKDADKKGDKKDTKKEEKKDPNAPPKLKTETPTVKLIFGKRERGKGLVYVRRESLDEDKKKVTVTAAVPDSLLDKVTAGPLAYLDRSIPGFLGTATKLTLDRNGQTYVLDKAKDKPDWKLAQPKNWAGLPANQNMVNAIVNELRSLRAEKLIAEKASAEQVQQYGLKAPRLKATVTALGADNKPEEHTYLFGDEFKDAKGNVTGVYAKQEKGDLIFTVSKADVDVLQGELRDPVVFHFDPAKVNRLKVEGWRSVVGSTLVRELEKKDGTWKVTKGDITPDQEKVDEFVRTLSQLRAVRFLDPKGEPKPQKMELKDDALQVEVTVEGDKTPYTLTVGGEAPDKTHDFASTNRLPGEYFLVPKKPFDDVRSKPAYFAK
jgi:hypothetical protein